MHLNEKQRLELLEYVFRLVYGQKYAKINKRLESIFVKDYSVKPVVAARIVSYYLRIPHSMLPLIVKLAQKAKDRVRKRLSKPKSAFSSP